MWVSRQQREHDQTQLIRAQERTEAQVQLNIALMTSMDWMKARLTQLEHERAILMERYMGIKIPVPEIVAEQKDSSEILQEMPSFDDVGDEMAKKLGVGWDPDGNVIHTGRQR